MVSAQDVLGDTDGLNSDILAILPSIIICTETDGTVLYMNPAAKEQFGGLTRLDETPIHEMDLPWDRQKISDGLRRCVDTSEPTRIDDIRCQKRNEPCFFGFTLYLQKGADGHRTVVWSGADITQKKMILGQLQQAQKMEAIGQLAAGVAHEINTPTQYILDNLNFLKDTLNDFGRLWIVVKKLIQTAKTSAGTEVDDVEALAKDIDVEYLLSEGPTAARESLEGAEQITRIVSAMKEFAHPETETKTPMNINRIVKNTITLSQNEWKLCASVDTELSAELPNVPCVPGLLNQVLLNLIVNASHAIAARCENNSDHPEGKIRVSTQEKDGRVVIAIADNGTGIPEEIQKRIFEPFFTTKEVGRGTGQGLAIAHDAIVKKHGGILYFESTIDVGTTFFIELPLE